MRQLIIARKDLQMSPGKLAAQCCHCLLYTSYHYYNEFLWPDRYADCVPMDKALELLKK